MFGGPQAAVARAIERVLSEEGPRRHKAIQRLAEILRTEGPEHFAEVPATLVKVIGDPDEVWGESLQVLRELLRLHPESILPAAGLIVETLRSADPARRRALELLRLITKRVPDRSRLFGGTAAANDVVAVI